MTSEETFVQILKCALVFSNVVCPRLVVFTHSVCSKSFHFSPAYKPTAACQTFTDYPLFYLTSSHVSISQPNLDLSSAQTSVRSPPPLRLLPPHLRSQDVSLSSEHCPDTSWMSSGTRRGQSQWCMAVIPLPEQRADVSFYGRRDDLYSAALAMAQYKWC